MSIRESAGQIFVSKAAAYIVVNSFRVRFAVDAVLIGEDRQVEWKSHALDGPRHREGQSELGAKLKT